MALEKSQMQQLTEGKKIELKSQQCYMKPLNLGSFISKTALMLSTIAGLSDNTVCVFV